MNRVTVSPPWTLVSCQESDHESSWMWTHPCGAVLSVQSREGDVAELVAGITMPPGVDDTDVTVPGPTWTLDQPIPAIVWAAGASGIVVTRGACDDAALTVWRQDMGDCHPVDEGVSLLGAEVALSPGSARMALWRGHPAGAVVEALECLPSWLPCETIVDPPEEMMCRTPDAGILVDGIDQTSETIGPLPMGAHDLVIYESRGATRVMIGWSPHVASAVGARVDEIV